MRHFKELHSIASQDNDALLFSSKDFRMIRVFLRLLSVWRPRSAGFLETYIYPFTVNMLLLTVGIIRNSIQATQKSTWLNVQMLYLVHEVVVWLGHILSNRYFASRDLEMNVLRPEKPLVGIRKLLSSKLKILNTAVVVSISFFSIMLSVLFVMTEFAWNEGVKRFSANLPYVHGPVDHILYGFVIVLIVYDIGIGLALSWTLALLYTCYTSRLKAMENMFLKWKDSAVDAVSLFTQLYARPVEKSWKRISWWFLAHNIVALAIPLYGYELAQAVSGREYHSKHLPQFICYLIFVLTLWIVPIFVGERIKQREKKFVERLNDISPWLLEVTKNDKVNSLGDSEIHPTLNIRGDLYCTSRETASQDSLASETSGNTSNYSDYTFICRGKELRTFLRFLKRRRPGLVSRGYSLQLNLSLISMIGGAISFLTELHTRNAEVVYRNCNCTM